MNQFPLLMIPGPTKIPPDVARRMCEPIIPHRSKEFSAILKDIYSNLKYVFQTKNDVFIFASSGTGAMCSALENLINNGDKVLCLESGVFGRRFEFIAKSLGADVHTMSVKVGGVISPDILEDYLSKNKTKIVTLTYSETSTGAANDVKTLCSIIKKYGAISVVDGISAIASMEFKMDEWGVDVAVAASQKGFMVPPGLSFLCAGDEALKTFKKCQTKSTYFNWEYYINTVKENSVPFTPPVTLLYGLDESLKLIQTEGIENVVLRHKNLAMYLRNSLKDNGFKLLTDDDKNASYTSTAVISENISSVKIIKLMKERYNIYIANGQLELKNKIFRIGTIGCVTKSEVEATVNALKDIFDFDNI